MAIGIRLKIETVSLLGRFLKSEMIIKGYMNRSILPEIRKYAASVEMRQKNLGEERFALHFKLDGVRYDEIIKVALEQLPNLLREEKKEDREFVEKLLLLIGEDQDALIHAMLGTLSEQKKERIIALGVARFEKQICAALSVGLQKATGMIVSGISVEKLSR